MTTLAAPPAPPRPYEPDAPLHAGHAAVAILRAVLRRWPVLAAAAFVSAAAVGLLVWSKPRTYTAVGTFVLQGGRSAPSLSGLASQFGITLPAGGDAGGSPALYLEVLRTRSVLRRLAEGSYCDPCGENAPRRPLPALLGVEAASPQEQLEETIRLLRDNVINGGLSPKTGVVSIAATAQSPVLAEQLAQAAMDAVVQFNLQQRQTQAGAERRFTEGRLAAVGSELRNAEQRLKVFRDANRVIDLSAELQLRESQLEREVRRYEEVYTALTRTLEQSKIDEVRDTPSILVLDAPWRPSIANPRGTVFKAIFAALVGGTVAAALLVWLELRRRRARP